MEWRCDLACSCAPVIRMRRILHGDIVTSSDTVQRHCTDWRARTQLDTGACWPCSGYTSSRLLDSFCHNSSYFKIVTNSNRSCLTWSPGTGLLMFVTFSHIPVTYSQPSQLISHPPRLVTSHHHHCSGPTHQCVSLLGPCVPGSTVVITNPQPQRSEG